MAGSFLAITCSEDKKMSHQESKIFEGVMMRFWDDYGTAFSSKGQAGTIFFNQLYFNISLFIRYLSEYFVFKMYYFWLVRRIVCGLQIRQRRFDSDPSLQFF
jgi:hypothetical protein